MRLWLAILIGRLVRSLARARGGGSALPGRIARILEPRFLSRTIGRLGTVVFVTGSNGKSTTTGMLVAILRAHGVRVFTNPAGSNLPQGLASAVLADVTGGGRLDADVAILEVDEAYGPLISRELTPDHLVVTNLQVDQLNRFGEPERVWEMMNTVAQRTRSSLTINARESALLSLGNGLPASAPVRTIDVSQPVIDAHPFGLVEAQIYSEPYPHQPDGSLTLSGVKGVSATVSDGSGQSHSFTLPGEGLHYAVDAALALSTAQMLSSDFSWDVATAALSSMPQVSSHRVKASQPAQETAETRRSSLLPQPATGGGLPSVPGSSGTPRCTALSSVRATAPHGARRAVPTQRSALRSTASGRARRTGGRPSRPVPRRPAS